MKRIGLLIIIGSVLVLACQAGWATLINLGGIGQQTVEWNGALFSREYLGPSGTGVFDPFIRIGQQGNTGTGQGYNSGEEGVSPPRPVQFQEDTNVKWNHAQLLSAVPIFSITYNNVTKNYYEFELDVNENGGEGDLISLDNLRLYESDSINYYPTNGQYAAPKLWGLDPLWDLQAGDPDPDYVELAQANKSGSGKADMLFYVPTSFFAPKSYVYLYSQFGAQGGNLIASDGFEEWGVQDRDAVVPEPASCALLALAAGGVGTVLKRRRK